MAQMNLTMKQVQTHQHLINLWLPRGGRVGEGWIGMADADYYIY